VLVTDGAIRLEDNSTLSSCNDASDPPLQNETLVILLEHQPPARFEVIRPLRWIPARGGMSFARTRIGSHSAIRKSSMNICIPTATDTGLDAIPYQHLGSAAYLVLHNTDTGETKVIRNRNEHHEHGACNPLHGLRGENVNAVIVGGIGHRAFARLHREGIRVYRATEAPVRQNVRDAQEGKLTEVTSKTACQGRDHGHHHHHRGHDHPHRHHGQ
jgi:predicted Fe-Mo cluster-binding NifX family protein